MTRSHQWGIAICSLAIAALAMMLGQSAVSKSRASQNEVQIAARYHLRSRTPDFYARAKPNGSRTSAPRK